MTKDKFKRIVAFYLALTIFFQVVSPTVALALTSGPGQPEMASFEPIGTTEMVDMFSGDFNYNIPLLTVPGPNGGYPVNIAYHAGIGMEDEASWVGLGWNINPGVISRQMRGLPDDFSGESVKKQISMRPNHTVGINFGIPYASAPEGVGFKYKALLSLGAQFNNYKGFGFAGGVSCSQSSKSSSFGLQASLNYNSLSGETDMSAGVSLSSQKNDAINSFGAKVSLNSLQGLKDLNFTYHRTKNLKQKVDTYSKDKVLLSSETYSVGSRSTSGGISFASSSFIPPSDMSQKGFNISTQLSIGQNLAGIDNRLQINANYNKIEYNKKLLEFSAYGYLHAKERTDAMSDADNNDDLKLMDFNREREITPSKDIPSMPASISTYDIYMVKGQGIGGIFRPMRTDVGLLVDPEIRGEVEGGTIGVEVGLGASWNVGLNLALNYTKNYTGPWHRSDLWDDVHNITYQGGNEPYFMLAGEQVADETEEFFEGKPLTPFPITTMVALPNFSDFSLSTADINPFVDIRVNNDGEITKNHFINKKTRSQLMSYKTFGEINSIPNYQNNWVNNHVFNENASPVNSGHLSNANPQGNQIGEISVTNPDGNRYIYALPAQNNIQKEVNFSIDPTKRVSPDDKIINYQGGGDNSTGNQQLDDYFYSYTEIPKYVHSYMLTAIVSPDYVDLTDNGLSNDDFGYWVKFNYTKTHSGYKWRAPFSGANFLRGHLSTKNDDKAGYTYGEKEIWYLNSIETKTHLASFVLDDNNNPRQDANGAVNEDQPNPYTGAPVNGNMDQTNPLRSLKKISLFAKADITKPLKEVNFGYNYELCKNTINSSAAGNGKLTLKTISFSYMANNKGSLSPYQFDYHANIADENPDYNILQEDRWGNYKENTFGANSTIFPYTPQTSDYNLNNAIDPADTTKRNAHASAWSLKEITLPSGGKMIVNYEPDDYAYVHDKKAMEMVRVVGFLPNPYGGTSLNLSTLTTEMTDKTEYLVFEINDATVNSTNVTNYIHGLSDIYFHIYINLKKNGIQGIPKKDYVNGYATIDTTECGIISPAGGSLENPGPYPSRYLKLGYIKVKKVPIHDAVNSFPFTHPFRKAAWQYLKLQRPDVLYPSSSASSSSGGSGLAYVSQVANSIITALTSSAQLFIGYNSYCEAAGYGKEMSKDAGYPSFIRLNTPDGIKYGGGHRVKSIVITDSWKETKPNPSDPLSPGEDPSQYGQEYSYRLADNTSSGVAAYEPLIGGEEIPQRKPIRYSSPYFIFKNENLYAEEPIGESFYPGASVGYSRVAVKNIRQTETSRSTTEVTKTKEGITVHEFYTSVDYPYSMQRSNLEHEKFNPKITIPFIGSVGFENHGFSQSMLVTTNDMHGRPKSIATYGTNADINNPSIAPVSKEEYIYSEYGNNINALFADGYFKPVNIGATTDKYIDMRETYGVSMNTGLQTNVYGYAFIVVPIILPIIDYSESINKSIVSMQIDNHTAVLMETKTTHEGSTVVAKNLMFDAYSGKPLLTSVTNDFDKPIYKYEYAAQWAYNGMANAYKNDRATVTFVTNGSGNLTAGTSTSLAEGDEILINNSSRAWVKGNSNGSLQLNKEDGTSAIGVNTTAVGLVIKSGRRNQQSVSNGYIVSLTNPVTDRKYNLFTDYNTNTGATSFSSTDCGTTVSKVYTKTFSSATSNPFIITLTGPSTDVGPGCKVTLTFPYDITSPITWNQVKLKKAGKKVYALHPTTNVVLATGDINDACGLTECLDGVLNASAAEFKDKGWVYDYQDVGDPVVNFSSGAKLSTLTAATLYNPYRLGNAGIWRMEKSYAYQTARLQTANATNINTTKIQDDGTFNDFALFNWDKAAVSPNTKWTKVNEVTKYNPYGFEVENKNAIGIFTSALYGYNNSVQTAITANASYYETAFDGFEDYPTTASDYANLPTTPLVRKGGHIALTSPAGNIFFENTNVHTGKRSIKGTGTQAFNMSLTSASNNYYFQAQPNKKYTISAWFKTADGNPTISVTGALSSEIFSDNIKIEGWQKIDLNFTTNSTVAVSVQFNVTGTSAAWYMDDVRLQPFKSSMKTFVYDPKSLWLVAELDNQNYATFYNYDEEGTLTQVKKETVNGVQTLKTTRSNIRR